MRANLKASGYDTVVAMDGNQATELAARELPDLILLDIMMPGKDGFEVCRILRKEMTVPILMLTARIEEIDTVVGLEMGADDYMAKPFSVRELLARIRARLRRSQLIDQQTPSTEEAAPAVLKAADIEVDVAGHRVLRNGSLLELSPKEFDLLSFLMHHRCQVFNRERLVEMVWGYDYGGTGRTVDVHVRSLRQKIEDNPEKPEHLLTVHGFGYKFEG